MSVPIVDSSQAMIRAIRHFGIIPFFKGKVPGWSVEELTPRQCWFTGEQLGPWDWKVDAVREGDIAYGKYISRKAAFATSHWYRHLMNWRRSQPQYRMALGEKCTSRTIDSRLNMLLSPVLLDAIREQGALEPGEMRRILSQRVDAKVLKKVGGHMEKYLLPDVRKQAVDFLLQYLEMGTWAVVGDITRVYRGPNLEYKGWQRSSVTTPDALFMPEPVKGGPFWARMIDESPEEEFDFSPEESRQMIIDHILGFFPGSEKILEKLI